MKALVLFRSYYGNTAQVAQAIGRQIREMGHESIVSDLRRKLPDLKGVDLIVIGSPTRMARVNRKAIGVLKRLAKKGFAGKPIAVFDTYGPVPTKPEELEKSKKWLYPGAGGVFHRRGYFFYRQNPVDRCRAGSTISDWPAASSCCCRPE